MTTVATCSDVVEAQLLKSVLENEGITAFLPDEMTASTAPHFLFASGIRLQVEDQDAAKARQVLSSKPTA